MAARFTTHNIQQKTSIDYLWTDVTVIVVKNLRIFKINMSASYLEQVPMQCKNTCSYQNSRHGLRPYWPPAHSRYSWNSGTSLSTAGRSSWPLTGTHPCPPSVQVQNIWPPRWVSSLLVRRCNLVNILLVKILQNTHFYGRSQIQC